MFELARGEVLAARADRRPVAGHAGRRDRARQRASRRRHTGADIPRDRRPDSARHATTFAGILAAAGAQQALSRRPRLCRHGARSCLEAPVITSARAFTPGTALRNRVYRAFAAGGAPHLAGTSCLPRAPTSPARQAGRLVGGRSHDVATRAPPWRHVQARRRPPRGGARWRKGEASGRLAKPTSPLSPPRFFPHAPRSPPTATPSLSAYLPANALSSAPWRPRAPWRPGTPP